jgi:hypothetical protein
MLLLITFSYFYNVHVHGSESYSPRGINIASEQCIRATGNRDNKVTSFPHFSISISNTLAAVGPEASEIRENLAIAEKHGSCKEECLPNGEAGAIGRHPDDYL